jgi:hypothetical protein
LTMRVAALRSKGRQEGRRRTTASLPPYTRAKPMTPLTEGGSQGGGSVR